MADQQTGTRFNEMGVSWDSSRPLFRTSLICFAVYCAITAAILMAAAVKAIPTHNENSYTEAPSVYTSISAWRTGHIYYQIDSPPYTPQPYGPFFYFYNAVLARLAHSDLLRTFLFGRLLTLITFILCAALIFRICKKLQCSAWGAALAAVVFLALPSYFYNVSIRPDYPCLLLMLASLFYAVRADPTRRLAYLPSAILGGTAILVKQSGVAILISIGIVLLWKKEFRQIAVLVLGSIVPIGLAVALLVWHHEPFWPQLTVMGKSFWSFQGGTVWILRFFHSPTTLMPVAILCLGLPVAAKSTRQQMIVSFTIISFFMAAAGVAQEGGDANYFFPAFAGAALLVPSAIQFVAQSRKQLCTALSLSMLIWIPLAAVHTEAWKTNAWRILRTPLKQPVLPSQALHKLEVLSDRPYFALLGSDPEFLDPWLLHSLELTGHWDGRAMAENIRKSNYDLVILANGGEPAVAAYRRISWFGAEIVEALNENYERLCEAPGPEKLAALVLKPRLRAVPVTAEMMTRTLGRQCVPEPRRPPALTVAKFAR